MISEDACSGSTVQESASVMRETDKKADIVNEQIVGGTENHYSLLSITDSKEGT